MTDKHNVGFTPQPRRLRSPSYPSIGLPEAISLARRIYDKASMYPYEQDVLAEFLGYDTGSSWLGLRLSALTKYGLAEIIPGNASRGKACVLTAMAETLVTWNPASDEYKSALRQAALRPPIYNDLWTQFGPDLPTNREMAAYLVDERRFNPNVINTLLADFRATAECADLKSMPTPKRTAQVDGATIDAYSRMHLPGAEGMRAFPPPEKTQYVLGQPFMGGPTVEDWRKALQQNSNERTTAIPLADGETATINMPKKMSPQSWQMLLDTLELWKKQAGAADVF
jgi:hypothetical protein